MQSVAYLALRTKDTIIIRDNIIRTRDRTMVKDNTIQINDPTTDTIIAIGATVIGKKGSTTAIVTDIEASISNASSFARMAVNSALKNDLPQPPGYFHR